MSVKLGKDLNKGDTIYRVIRVDNVWYYCIYEVVMYHHYYFDNTAKLYIAPIITWYEANHSSISTLCLTNVTENWIEIWVHTWDYVTTDENMAKCMYYEKTGIIE